MCGETGFEAKCPPVMSAICQCTSCQKLSGAGYGAHMAFPRAMVELKGSSSSYAWKADSGNTVTSSFCPNVVAQPIMKTAPCPS